MIFCEETCFFGEILDGGVANGLVPKGVVVFRNLEKMMQMLHNVVVSQTMLLAAPHINRWRLGRDGFQWKQTAMQQMKTKNMSAFW